MSYHLFQAVIMAASEIQHHAPDPLAHLEADDTFTALARHQALSGCYPLIGPIQICYSWNGAEMELCLQVGGIKGSCMQVNTSNPCAKLEGRSEERRVGKECRSRW